MNKRKRRRLIMVVDDVAKYREDLLPGLATAMECRTCKAATIQDAIRLATKHGRDCPDPLDLVILDMHLPKDDSSAARIEESGGTQCLRAVVHFRSLHCPCVVFTAFPSFADCVAVVQAGADAYIPKVGRGSEGGPDALREVCERLLRTCAEPEEHPPTQTWLRDNHGWLAARYNDKWVAFISKNEAPKGKIKGAEERDRILLLAGATYDEVRDRILEFPDITKAQPTILRVRSEARNFRTKM